MDPDHGIHLRTKSMARVTSGHPSNINRITPDRHRLGHETGQNRVKPVIRSRHGHISHGNMKFTRKDVISSGAREDGGDRKLRMIEALAELSDLGFAFMSRHFYRAEAGVLRFDCPSAVGVACSG
jgi:hypothetical protein